MGKQLKLILLFLLLLLLSIIYYSNLQSLGSWTIVCDGDSSCTPGSTIPNTRGFYYKIPWDYINLEFIYYGGTVANTSIYSNAIWGMKWNGSGYVFTKHIDNGATTDMDCPFFGGMITPPGNGYNPILGHPQGYIASDPLNNRIIMTEQLCATYFSGFTSTYLTSSQTMSTIIAHSPSAITGGDGTFNANWRNYQNIECPSGYGKCIYGFSDGSSNLSIIETSDLISYSDVTSSIHGSDGPTCISGMSTQCPPAVLTVPATMNDGHYTYVGGGCNGSSPGNISPNLCNGANQNDIYRYDSFFKIFDKMTAVGGIKPSAMYSSYPMLTLDTKRFRFLWYDGASLWAGNISGTFVTWTTLTVGGTSPNYTATIGGRPNAIANSNGNSAAYDPFADNYVIFSGVTQTNAPIIEYVPLGNGSVGGIGVSSKSIVVH